ncbi:SIR2 family NAD-dependent protein deacylase [Actinomadura parmotrematis]|uniref:protein acetyllysine N-acetyltransferase n=1 Tax=Actinomadura parmotrematis TaxID=2864039 RepID=A0ABS7G492_9ACTN|nr:Sir2 family NAD-dependent protein deacetylase [Actinomadura parmotrematis]MBW8487532.1 Sir2 family NAD-dependent protein deacetylase [Actinomadura parmotrematis]
MGTHLPSWARGATRVAVLTGAGISTDSGIPDYRGPEGIWTKDPSLAGLFTRKHFLNDADGRRRFWRAFAELRAAGDVRPNAAHVALAELEAAGVAVRVLTQNVDGLHQKAGSTARKVLELHGNMESAECTHCHAIVPIGDVIGQDDPACGACGGVVQPSIVMFGQFLDRAVLGQAAAIAQASRLMLAVGSSLSVEPAAGLCGLAVRAGVPLVVVNRDPTPYDDLADEVVREPIGTALPRICGLLRERLGRG